MKKYNATVTTAAYESRNFKMDTIVKFVHEELLVGTFLYKHCKLLRKIQASIASKHGDVTYSSAIGMFSKQMPPLDAGVNWSELQKEQMKVIAAQLFINILEDSGEVVIRQEITPIDPEKNRGKSFRKLLIVSFNGSKPERCLSAGLESEPGVFTQRFTGNIKLPNSFVQLGKQIASMKFKLSCVASLELIIHGLKLSKDYHSSNKDNRGEARADKKKRLVANAEHIMNEIGSMDCFYLPIKYDTRARMYYLFQLIGLRPQGKLWETLLIDAAESTVRSVAAIPHLKHIIYVTKYGRCSVDHAVNNWTCKDYDYARNADPMAVKHILGNERKQEKAFGEAILVNKAIIALERCENGKPCNFIFGKDLTNSGLMMAGANFKSSEMQKASNLHVQYEVEDAYTTMKTSFGLSQLNRDAFKRMLTPVLHGSYVLTMVKQVQTALQENGADEHTVNSIDVDFAEGALIGAFGKSIKNIIAIAQWGAKAVNNYQTKLYWTTPDGFPAQHCATINHCPVVSYAVSGQVKAGFRRADLIFNMPYHEQNNGQPIYDREYVPVGCERPPEVGKQGLYANITHGLDGNLLRNVVHELIARGQVCLLKHDDYMVAPDQYEEIIRECQKFFKDCSANNYYSDALRQIVSKGNNMPLLPDLHVGTSEVQDSINFLMP